MFTCSIFLNEFICVCVPKIKLQCFCGVLDVTFLSDPGVFLVHSYLRKEEKLFTNVQYTHSCLVLLLIHFSHLSTPSRSPHLLNPLFLCHADDSNLLTSLFLFTTYLQSWLSHDLKIPLLVPSSSTRQVNWKTKHNRVLLFPYNIRSVICDRYLVAVLLYSDWDTNLKFAHLSFCKRYLAALLNATINSFADFSNADIALAL